METSPGHLQNQPLNPNPGSSYFVASPVRAISSTSPTNEGNNDLPPNNGLAHMQFCLRWHNHQTSLLSTLPQLLDQSHLTDVTLIADGRKIKAHRLVLSACSQFFSELFHNLESNRDQQCHPVIVLPPHTHFSSLAALITFMYSGEVNVFEDQISTLLSLAETLGIKGLTDINDEANKCKNIPTSTSSSTPETPTSSIISKAPNFSPAHEKESSTPPPPFVPTKLLSNFDAFFPRPPAPFNFYPHHLLTQPLNFSTNRSHFLSNQHPQMMPPQGMVSQSPISQHQSSETPSYSKSNNNLLSEANRNFLDDMYKKEKIMMDSIDSKKMKMGNLKKIDKIAENLRFGVNPPSPGASNAKNFLEHFNQITQKSVPNQMLLPPPSSQSSFPLSSSFLSDKSSSSLDQLGSMSFSESSKKASPGLSTSTPTKIPNSKLFAKCFICNKLLSNQYNLRVHLETHQNMRYACTVCSHVSRSKDALRKHISYRHPGTPSPACENSESRRKRTKLASQIQQMQAQQILKDQAAGIYASKTPQSPHTPTSLGLETAAMPHHSMKNEMMMSSANANQLALLQSFTSELTIPSIHQQHSQISQISSQPIKQEINNNSEVVAGPSPESADKLIN